MSERERKRERRVEGEGRIRFFHTNIVGAVTLALCDIRHPLSLASSFISYIRDANISPPVITQYINNIMRNVHTGTGKEIYNVSCNIHGGARYDMRCDGTERGLRGGREIALRRAYIYIVHPRALTQAHGASRSVRRETTVLVDPLNHSLISKSLVSREGRRGQREGERERNVRLSDVAYFRFIKFNDRPYFGVSGDESFSWGR